jgi:hypothetical protein
MAEDTGLGKCKEKSGFLFSHACKRDAISNCAKCGKAICEEHTHEFENQLLCTSCVNRNLKRRESREDRVHYHDPYFYWYGRYHGYGYYGPGSWGYRHHVHHYHDRDDFTEADGQSLNEEGYAGWEQEMGES